MPWKSALATFGRRMGKLKRQRLTMDKPEIWKAERRTGRELEQLAFGRGFRQDMDELMTDATRILNAIAQGKPSAAHELLPLVYDELRRLAAQKLANEPAGQTLQPTALVHEAWLRLVGNEPAEFSSRGHFFGAAAEAMRRILIERARQKKATKRGGGVMRLNLDEVDVAATTDDATLLLVDEALEKLADEDAEAAQFVKLRFFAGFTNQEAALALGVPERTARRHWTYARAWLYREIQRLRVA